MNKTGSQLEKIRLQLLDLGLRGNTMLHFAPRGTKTVSVVDEKSASVFDILVTQGKSMSFLARPGVYNEEEDVLADGQVSEDYEKLPPLGEYLAETKGESRFDDLDLQTSISSDQLDLRLLKIENEAKTIFQERGIDVLYLAAGFLQWFEDKNSSKKRYAPLVLLPVELIRKGAGKGFKLKYTGMELSSNETLYAKLENDFKIQLPLLDDFIDEDVDLKGYFESISALLKEQERKLELVAPQEISKGILDVVKEAMSINPAECFSEAATRLGFQRVTAQMTDIFKECLDSLVRAGEISAVDGRLFAAKS